MQTQNESQACENKGSFPTSSSRPVPKGSDTKPSPQRNSGSPSPRSLLAGAAPLNRPVRPLLASSVSGYGGVSSAGRHTSLVTCAESLSPPLRSDLFHRSFRPYSPDPSSLVVKEEIHQLVGEELDCSPLKTPLRDSDPYVSSSRCGSPSEDPDFERDVTGIGSQQPEPSKATNLEPLRCTPASSFDSGHDLSPRFKEGSPEAEDEKERTGLDTFPLESHSLEVENSDSSIDAGNNEYRRSPVRGPRTLPSEKKGRLDRKALSKALSNGWMSPIPSISKGAFVKGIQSGEACREDFPTNTRDGSPEDANATRSNMLRSCFLCGTTKTPLWRSGPHGPKSLCNACGIRFKKSKRSGQIDGSDLVASPVSASTYVSKPLSRPLKRKQDTFLACEASLTRDSTSEPFVAEVTVQHQKRSRWPKLMMKELDGHKGDVTGSSGDSCLTWNLHSPSSGSPSSKKLEAYAKTQSEFENLAVVEGRRTAVTRVVANDEEEAAVLLMYLSCGLVYA